MQANRRIIERRADMCYAARVAQATDQSFRDAMTRFKWQIMNIDDGGK